MADSSQVSAELQKDNKGSINKSVNLLSLSAVRRDGSITPFKSDKISNAIKKAFLAQTKIRNNKNREQEQQDSIYKTVELLTHKVVSALTRRIANGAMISVFCWQSPAFFLLYSVFQTHFSGCSKPQEMLHLKVVVKLRLSSFIGN